MMKLILSAALILTGVSTYAQHNNVQYTIKADASLENVQVASPEMAEYIIANYLPQQPVETISIKSQAPHVIDNVKKSEVNNIPAAKYHETDLNKINYEIAQPVKK